MNGQSSINLLTSVEQFGLTYDIATLSVTEDSGTENSQPLLHSHNVTNSLKEYQIKVNDWGGQYIKPSLPANTLHWSIERVEFYAKTQDGVDSVATMQIQSATSGKWPTTEVDEEKLLDESSLLDNFILNTGTDDITLI